MSTPRPPGRGAVVRAAAGFLVASFLAGSCVTGATAAVATTAATASPPNAVVARPPVVPAPAPIAFTERRLANGLQVIAVPNHASPTVSVQVWYHVGSRDDPPGRSGFAHLFEHLMFKSTKNLRSEQFDRLTEDVGGANNASTGDDVTEFHESIPSNHLQTLLWAEAERMSNLNVDEPTFRSERAVVEEEYRQRVLASPYGRLFSVGIAPAAYSVHPYRRPTIGSIEDLEAASLADVAAFHRTFYRPDNATLVVAGDFDPKQLDAWVDTYFGPIARPSEPIPRVAAVEPAWTADRRVALTGPNVPLPATVLAWQAPAAGSPDAPALQIAAALLATGESSRLNESLVYRQRLATQVGVDADLRDGPSILSVYAIAAAGRSLAGIRDALLAEVRALAARPVGAAELAKVKTQLLTSALLGRETPAGLATAVASAAVIEHDPHRADADLAALQKVSAQDVQRVVQRYLVGAHVLTIDYTAGPDPTDTRPTPTSETAR